MWLQCEILRLRGSRKSLTTKTENTGWMKIAVRYHVLLHVIHNQTNSLKAIVKVPGVNLHYNTSRLSFSHFPPFGCTSARRIRHGELLHNTHLKSFRTMFNSRMYHQISKVQNFTFFQVPYYHTTSAVKRNCADQKS